MEELQSSDREVWIETDDGRSLCALISREWGWLMYLRQSGDAGFSSRNPDYNGPPEVTLEFHLSNGQVDEYPMEWALPVSQVQEALDYFRCEQKPPPFIIWHNDSGDGADITAELSR